MSLISRHTMPTANMDAAQSLRDALIVALVQAWMTRGMMAPEEMTDLSPRIVREANKIAAIAYPDEGT